MQHCQNFHFEMICPKDGNLSSNPLELFHVHVKNIRINFRNDWLSYGCV